MKFQFTDPSQVPIPTTVFGIVLGNAIVAIALDQQTAEAIKGYNSAYTIVNGELVD